jgi:hypothetical protein
MPSNMPPWFPSLVGLGTFVSVVVLISLHPRFRKTYRPRPAPGQPTLFQKRERGPGVTYAAVAGPLHYKPMVAAWFGVVCFCVVAAMVMIQMPLPIAATGTPVVLLLAVLAYLRPRGAVQSCYVDQNGGITLMRRAVTIPFEPAHYRCIRMHTTQTRSKTYPSMLVLYRNMEPSWWSWLGSVLIPRVNDERVAVFFNRWRDADGYFVGPRDLGALFYQACVRAGRPPTEPDGILGTDGWEACGR